MAKKEHIGDNQIIGQISDTYPKHSAQIYIDGIDSFYVDLQKLNSKREDLFRTGQFSVFDVLVGLAEKGNIEIEYHFDEGLNT